MNPIKCKVSKEYDGWRYEVSNFPTPHERTTASSSPYHSSSSAIRDFLRNHVEPVCYKERYKTNGYIIEVKGEESDD